jgi:hypothetical protein
MFAKKTCHVNEKLKKTENDGKIRIGGQWTYRARSGYRAETTFDIPTRPAQIAVGCLEKRTARIILVSCAGGDKRRPRRRVFCTFRRELESIHFADPDLDSLFTSRELRERLRIVVAEVIRENDLRPHCFNRINEHVVIHCVELGSEARIVNR